MELMLRKASNGGWIITDNVNGQGYIPKTLAAYTNTDDMMKGLAEILYPLREAEEERS